MFDAPWVIAYYLQAKYFRRFLSRRQLERWQQKKLKKVLRNAPKRYRFYAHLSEPTYSNFPIQNKRSTVHHFQDLNAYQIPSDLAFDMAVRAEKTREFKPMLGKVTVGLSTGTSGSRGLFLANRKERLRWAGTVLAKVLPKPIWKSSRIAFCFRANSNLYTTVSSNQSIQFRFFDLLDPFEQLIEQLNAAQPDLLVAPAYFLRLLAQAKENQHLTISPTRVISVAEVLEDVDREIIERNFQKPIHQIYQATEGFIGSTCRFGTLHLNEDLLFFEKEYLDSDPEPSKRRFVPIITDLFRSSQAMIRYRLNDVLIEKTTQCPCGSIFTAIEKVEGRCDDVFYLPDSKQNTLRPIYPDLIRNRLVQDVPHLHEFQVIQISPMQIEIRYELETTEDRGDQLLQALQNLFQEMGLKIPHFEIQRGVKIDLSGKLRRVLRKFEVNHL